MLKAFLGFLVSVVVLLSSAYVITPAYAASATVLITQIQAGGSSAATQEFISLYNNSSQEVDLSGWCLANKSNLKFACITVEPNQSRYVAPYAYAVVASSSFAASLPTAHFAAIYVPSSQSSGSITGGGDTISLIDHLGVVVDQHTWTVSIAGGSHFERRTLQGAPLLYQDSDKAIDWSVLASGPAQIDATKLEELIVDVCLNIEGTQPTLPIGMQIDEHNACVMRVIMKLDITEILPNAIGVDEGNEFIELYNPNNEVVDLSKYELFIGPEFNTMYDFPTGSMIQARAYLSFSNSAIAFGLLNSSSRALLALKDGFVVSEVAAYKDPKDGMSWAFIEGIWQYTNYPTPGAVNVAMVIGEEGVTDGMSGSAKSCVINQYRSLETNRCRLLTTLGTTVTPCKDGQYRSEETNRCRNIATDAKTVTPCDEDEVRNAATNRCRKIVSASTAPAACKEGQERSPETNRCRTVKTMSAVGYGVLGAKTEGGGNWYALAVVGGVLLLALGYGIWEWHDEIGKFIRKSFNYVRRFVRLRK